MLLSDTNRYIEQGDTFNLSFALDGGSIGAVLLQWAYSSYGEWAWRFRCVATY